MMKMYQAYLDQISAKAFNGETIHYLEGSLYQVGADPIIIAASAPSTDDYVFGLRSAFSDETEWVVFGCRNDSCIFKIPSSLLGTLHFSLDRKSGRKILTIHFDHKTHDWYLVSKKQNARQGHVINISNYKIDLRDEEDIIAQCAYLRKALGM
ncbi:hypothetical protein [Paenibacillus eucommiae]|uniref:Uncharacterized protein n=1 Tax=Paenibacillus eucommiae TaxID=1355755 RepID=A0ABS4J335_9BACL|nr:hypothetical protein [Paenibacillus eucommiae]MBP1994218.1 hypothetical protein [Paenibacillus eucommiae]